MSDQADFASLLFGSVPDVPPHVSTAMLDHTFTAAAPVDDADLIPAGFDALDGDEHAYETHDGTDGFADDGQHSTNWAHDDASDVHHDLYAADPDDHPHHDDPYGHEHDHTDHLEHHDGGDWSGDLG